MNQNKFFVTIFISTVFLTHFGSLALNRECFAETAVIDDDSANDDADLYGHLLEYSADLYRYNPSQRPVELYHKIGSILERMALRGEKKLDSIVTIYGSEKGCLKWYKDDRICTEGYASALIQAERIADAAPIVQKLLLQPNISKTDEGLFLLLVSMAEIKLQAFKNDDTTFWASHLTRLVVNTARDRKYPRTPAKAILALLNTALESESLTDVGQNCNSEGFKIAKRLLIEPDDFPGPIRSLALGRVYECEALLDKAIQEYRSAVTLPLTFFSAKDEKNLLNSHPSIIRLLRIIRSKWEIFIHTTATTALERLLTMKIRDLPSSNRNAPVLTIRTYPRKLDIKNNLLPISASLGGEEGFEPLVIEATATHSLWVGDILIYVNGKLISDESWLSSKLEFEHPVEQHEITSPQQHHLRRLILRLTLPSSPQPYAFKVEAQSILCRITCTAQDKIEENFSIGPIYPRHPPEDSDSQGLLIGIGNYFNNLDYRRLNSPPNDAIALRKLLSNPLRSNGSAHFDSRQLELLIDSQASHEAVKKALNRLSTKSEITRTKKEFRYYYKDKIILLYFSGHGVSALAGTGREKLYMRGDDTIDRMMTCLLLYNADPPPPGECPEHALSATQMGELLEKMTVRALIVIIDSCNSGDAHAFSENVWIYTPERAATGGAVMISAAPVEFSAADIDILKNSLLTAFILQGLRGKADLNGDNQITVSELWQYLQEKVPTVFQIPNENKVYVPIQRPTLTTREWKDPVVLINNKKISEIHVGLTRLLGQGNFQLKEALSILNTDPNPDSWSDLLDQNLVVDLASEGISNYDEFLRLISETRRVGILAERN